MANLQGLPETIIHDIICEVLDIVIMRGGIESKQSLDSTLDSVDNALRLMRCSNFMERLTVELVCNHTIIRPWEFNNLSFLLHRLKFRSYLHPIKFASFFGTLDKALGYRGQHRSCVDELPASLEGLEIQLNGCHPKRIGNDAEIMSEFPKFNELQELRISSYIRYNLPVHRRPRVPAPFAIHLEAGIPQSIRRLWLWNVLPSPFLLRSLAKIIAQRALPSLSALLLRC